MELRIREVDFKECAKSKVANGVVAVGFPHRNYSVFNQTQINQRKVKGRIRIGPRFSARVTKGGESRTRACEAKGPFPGGKRVGSRGSKRKQKC